MSMIILLNANGDSTTRQWVYTEYSIQCFYLLHVGHSRGIEESTGFRENQPVESQD